MRIDEVHFLHDALDVHEGVGVVAVRVVRASRARAADDAAVATGQAEPGVSCHLAPPCGSRARAAGAGPRTATGAGGGG